MSADVRSWGPLKIQGHRVESVVAGSEPAGGILREVLDGVAIWEKAIWASVLAALAVLGSYEGISRLLLS
jgi:hypothetical protein